MIVIGLVLVFASFCSAANFATQLLSAVRVFLPLTPCKESGCNAGDEIYYQVMSLGLYISSIAGALGTQSETGTGSDTCYSISGASDISFEAVCDDVVPKNFGLNVYNLTLDCDNTAVYDAQLTDFTCQEDVGSSIDFQCSTPVLGVEWAHFEAFITPDCSATDIRFKAADYYLPVGVCLPFTLDDGGSTCCQVRVLDEVDGQQGVVIDHYVEAGCPGTETPTEVEFGNPDYCEVASRRGFSGGMRFKGFGEANALNQGTTSGVWRRAVSLVVGFLVVLVLLGF